jgi:spore coat polysaccharide biosynthesis protein SpsF (cytidylyltransferase family)/methionyl-tRNA formyltransferase
MKYHKSSFKIFLQVRYDSKRLYGKSLLNFPEKNILNFLIKRLKKNKFNIPIILLTTNRQVDKKIIKVAKQNNIDYFAGSYKNVFKRFLDASQKFNVENIIRVCGDNPLTDIKFLEECVDKFSKGSWDHLSTFHKPAVPYGTGCAIFKSSLLKKEIIKKLNKFDLEHVEPFFLRSKKIKTLFYKSKNKNFNKRNLSFSIDTEKEYFFVKKICENIYNKKGLNFDISDLIKKVERLSAICFLNGNLGLNILKKLVNLNIKIKLVILHPPSLASKDKEISKLCRDNKIKIVQPNRLIIEEKNLERIIKQQKADLCLTIWSSYIFSKNIIDLFPRGVVNLHNSFLPENKGSNANIHYILKDKEPGVTLHYVSKEIDSGAIIDQYRFKIDISETGYSLQQKMEKEMVKIFLKNWNKIKNFNYKLCKIQTSKGNYNLKGKILKNNIVNLDKNYKALDLINFLRAFTYKGYVGAKLKHNDILYECKVFIKKK